MLKPFLFYNRRTYVTGKALAECLGVPCSKEKVPKEVNCLIRWGNSIRPGYDVVEGRAVFNLAEFLGDAVNKEHTFRKLLRNTVAVPHWKRDVDDFCRYENGRAIFRRENLDWSLDNLWIYRSRYGSGGQDIYFLDGGLTDDIEVPRIPGGILVRFVKSVCELRVHIVQGKSVAMQIKLNEQGEPTSSTGKDIRNHANGWRLLPFSRSRSVELGIDRRIPRRIAKQAITACRLDFGAVDLVKSTTGTWKVLEVNTGPGLEGSTLEAYCAAFKSILEI